MSAFIIGMHHNNYLRHCRIHFYFSPKNGTFTPLNKNGNKSWKN